MCGPRGFAATLKLQLGVFARFDDQLRLKINGEFDRVDYKLLVASKIESLQCGSGELAFMFTYQPCGLESS